MSKSEWSQWYKVNDKASLKGFSIRRYRVISGKTQWERYPTKEYKELSLGEVDSLLNRLNASHKVRIAERDEQFNYDLAYVNKTSLGKFEEYLSSQANDQNHITSSMAFLNNYGLKFFIVAKDIPDPAQWHKASVSWGEWLLKQDIKPATIVKVVTIVNRFTAFLQENVYTEMPAARKLAPIGRNKLKRMALSSDGTKFITDETWVKIVDWVKANDPGVLPNVLLSEAYGLRLSESQGLDKSKFFNSYLLVSEQGDRIKLGKLVLKPIKTIDTRKVPHWNIEPRAAWELVKTVEVMHPDTLNKRVNEGFNKFGHTSHDMRRRFITKALRAKETRDVQLAVGHKNIMTTMGYAEDDRELQDQMMNLD